jgi:hypothetical protein
MSAPSMAPAFESAAPAAGVLDSNVESEPGLRLHIRCVGEGKRRSMIRALSGGRARSAGELGAHFRSAQPTITPSGLPPIRPRQRGDDTSR